MSTENQPDVVALPSAGVPADQGLSSLGLLMQLAGTIFAVLASLMAFVMLLAMRGARGGSEFLWIFLVLGLSIARSAYHRIAGAELLYGRRTLDPDNRNPLGGLKRYIAVALVHSVVLALILKTQLHAPGSLVVGLMLGMAAWPALLAGLFLAGSFQRFQREIPMAEDKGFEGAAILMTVLGVCGVLGSGAFLLLMLEGGGRMLTEGFGILMLVSVVMLVIRSGLHVQAGLSGLRETSVDRSVELANRYANFGVITAFCVGGSLLLIMMRAVFDPSGMVAVVGVCWLLMAWPLIIRRFFSDRQFADLLAGDDAAIHRRAPDAGLTGLGWLLVGWGMYGASFLIPQIVLGESRDMPRQFGELFALAGPMGLRSNWWSAGLIVLQLWAGFELVRMSAHRQIIGTVYAVVAVAISLYVYWPVVEMLKHSRGFGSPTTVMMFVPIAIQLVLPISTLILVNRKIAPTARARFRSRPAGPPAGSPPAAP